MATTKLPDSTEFSPFKAIADSIKTEEPDDLEKAVVAWQAKPDQAGLVRLLDMARPIVDKGVTMYAPGSSASARGKARVMVAQALRGYKPDKKIKLQTYLLSQLQPLQRFAKESNSAFHIPEASFYRATRLSAAENELKDSLHRDPTALELAEHVGMSVKELARHRKYLRREAPASTYVDEQGHQLEPVASTTDPMDLWAEAVYQELSPINRSVMEWKTGFAGSEQLSNQEIARRLGISPSAVTQRAETIAKKLAQGIR